MESGSLTAGEPGIGTGFGQQFAVVALEIGIGQAQGGDQRRPGVPRRVFGGIGEEDDALRQRLLVAGQLQHRLVVLVGVQHLLQQQVGHYRHRRDQQQSGPVGGLDVKDEPARCRRLLRLLHLTHARRPRSTGTFWEPARNHDVGRVNEGKKRCREMQGRRGPTGFG